MGNLLFSPSGRIGPSDYFKGMMIIAVIGALLSLLTLVSPTLGMVGSLASIVFLYCFFAMTIKRTHDAGRSGWMSIVWFIVLIVISIIISSIIGAITGVGMMDLINASMSGDVELTQELTKKSVLPSAVGGLISYAVGAYVINMLNKGDPGDNQYGPAT